jgi:hypothetical protein
MKGRVRLFLAAYLLPSVPALLWGVGAFVAVANFEMPLVPAAPHAPSKAVRPLEERARQPLPPPKPKDKAVDFAPWEEVPT